MKKIIIAICAIAVIIAALGIYWIIYLQKAHSTFENYYAFRGCAKLMQKTDTYGLCKLPSGEIIKIVKYQNKWFLDGDLPWGAKLPPAASSTTPTSMPATPATTTLEYQNTQYGFSFALPASWQGYSIITDKWQGYTPGPSGQILVETGPIISIRHPLWTAQTPRQDIPIMIFTLKQWAELEQDKFHIGAAPIGPSELGRNASYVLALPARYNFAFPVGYEEVEKILEAKPLKAF
jgi:hypothetical protein